MEPKQISLHKVTLNISSPREGGINLNKGELLRGVVQGVSEEGLVILRLKGKLLEARSEIIVKPGQELYLQVDEFKNNKTYLKVVSPQMLANIETSNLSNNLISMGIPAREDTVLIAKKLFQHYLPVNPSSLSDIAKGLQILGGFNVKNLEVAALALSLGLISRESLLALAQFLSQQTDSRDLVDLLLQLSQALEKGQGVKFNSHQLSQKVVQLLQVLLESMVLNLDQEPAAIASQLSENRDSEKDVMKAWDLLVKLAADKSQGEELLPLKESLHALASAEKEVIGQHFFNMAPRLSADNSGFFYFSFPVKTPEGFTLCQLKINKDKDKKLDSVDKISFVVSLDTEKMGIVLFYVNWNKKGEIKLQGVVENPASGDFLNKNIDELLNSLRKLGYTVFNQGVKVKPPGEEIHTLKPTWKSESVTLRPLGVDVIV